MTEQAEFRLGPIGVVAGSSIACSGCNYAFPPGARVCPVCGFERARYAGAEYPAGRWERFPWVVEQPIDDHGAFATLCALVHFDRPGGAIFPSMKRLAATARLSERATRNGVRWLERHGWIVVEKRRARGRQTSNRYTIRQAEEALLPARGAASQPARGAA